MLIDPDRARRHMEARGLDVLVGAGYVNYGYIAGYFTHFGRDYPGPLYNGLPMVRFSALPRDPALPRPSWSPTPARRATYTSRARG